jgi:excisionase family DNA binding protein
MGPLGHTVPEWPLIRRTFPTCADPRVRPRREGVGHPARPTASGTPGRTRVGCGTLCTVSDAPQDAGPEPVDDLEALVGSWLTIPDIAERLGLPLSSVRKLVEDRELLAHRVGERRVVSVPAGFVDDQGPLHALKGTFTVLADGGMSDTEILRWLHTPDDTLPVPGSPLDAIHAGFKTEVRRRAMEVAL